VALHGLAGVSYLLAGLIAVAVAAIAIAIFVHGATAGSSE
jgi:hypothetical protein